VKTCCITASLLRIALFKKFPATPSHLPRAGGKNYQTFGGKGQDSIDATAICGGHFGRDDSDHKFRMN
jgi:hypothetical protein